MKAKHWAALLATIFLTVVALSPIFAPELFFGWSPDTAMQALAAKIVACFIPIAAVLICTKVPLPQLPSSSSQRLKLFLLLIFMAFLQTDLHRTMVDEGNYFNSPDLHNNTAWQQILHNSILQKSPQAIPHSYRFLPDSFIGTIEAVSGDFEFSRYIYRLTFSFLLLFSIYYYANLYVKMNAALAVLLAYMLVYPVSIRYYAGQPIDPMSHLSFVLTFIFIELDLVWFFSAAIAIGILAKESVACMAIYPLLFRGSRPKNWLFSLALPVIILLELWLIRLWINGGSLKYQSISGVSLNHIFTNLSEIELCLPQTLFTIGIFFPFLWGSWRNAPYHPKRLIILLAPALIITNAMFSWFYESRNFIPLVIPLAILTVMSFMPQTVARQGDN